MSFLFIDYDKTKNCGIIKSDFLDNIREYFSEKDDKADLKKRLFHSRFIPSRRYIITEQGRFEFGMLYEIVKYLKSLQTPFKIVFSEEFKQAFHSTYNFSTETITPIKLPYRPYQEEGLKKALTNGCGLIINPTGTGKTAMEAGIVVTVRQHIPTTKTLIVVPTHLIQQTRNEFVNEYGLNADLINTWSGDSDDKLDTTKPIVICGQNIVCSKVANATLELKKAKLTYLTLKRQLESNFSLQPKKRQELENLLGKIEKDISRLKIRSDENKAIQEFFKSIDLLIIDEIHQFKKSNEITELLKYITTRHRFGFTGTLPESLIDQWNIIGKIGPIVYETPREDVVRDGYIADVDIRILRLHHKDISELDDLIYDDEKEEDEEKSSRYEDELQFIHKSFFRNQTIKKCCEKLTKNILIPVDRIEHGEILLDFLKTYLPTRKIFFIKGEVDNEVREEIKQIMEKEDGIICIAISRIFSTGVNIKNLYYIIFAMAGKAKVKIVQTIGRGVRLHQQKTKITILDIADRLHYSDKHLTNRIQLYENENFKYKIIDIWE